MTAERPLVIEAIDNIAKKVEYGLFVVASVLLAVLAAVVFYATLGREFGLGAAWVLEVSEYAMVVLTFFAAAWLLRTDGHIKIDILERYLSRRLVHVTSLVAACVLIAVCLILSLASIDYVQYLHERGALRRETLVVPEWLIYLPISIGAVTALLESVLGLLRTVARNADDGRSQEEIGN